MRDCWCFLAPPHTRTGEGICACGGRAPGVCESYCGGSGSPIPTGEPHCRHSLNPKLQFLHPSSAPPSTFCPCRPKPVPCSRSHPNPTRTSSKLLSVLSQPSRAGSQCWFLQFTPGVPHLLAGLVPREHVVLLMALIKACKPDPNPNSNPTLSPSPSPRQPLALLSTGTHEAPGLSLSLPYACLADALTAGLMGRERKAAFCSLGCSSNPASCRAVSHTAQLERSFGLQICTALPQSTAISYEWGAAKPGWDSGWDSFAVWQQSLHMCACMQCGGSPSPQQGMRRLQRSLPSISSKGRQRGRGQLPLHRELVGAQSCHWAE